MPCSQLLTLSDYLSRPRNHDMPDRALQLSSASLTHSPSSCQPLAVPDSDWLAPVRRKPLLTKGLNGSFIHKHQHKDWFLSLTNALIGIGQVQQGRSLAKVYIFLRMFMPKGLTGRWGHLRGKNLMDNLLSHPEGLCVSRHKATRDADAALTELEKWMEQGSTWLEAWRHAKANLATQNGVKLRDTGRAPVLFSPDHLIMILILSYPDMKYHERIRHLQIGWMAEARETLRVEEGFWKGITAESVGSVFVPEDVSRISQVELLLDYDRLFGQEFPQFRQNIRPCLPSEPWTQSINLLQDPSDDESPDHGNFTKGRNPHSILQNHTNGRAESTSHLGGSVIDLTSSHITAPDPTQSDHTATDLRAIAHAAIHNAQRPSGQISGTSLVSHSRKRTASPNERSAKRPRLSVEYLLQDQVNTPSTRGANSPPNTGKQHRPNLADSRKTLLHDDMKENLVALKDDITKTVLEHVRAMQSTALTETRAEGLIKSALHDTWERLGRLDTTFSTRIQELDCSFQETLQQSSFRDEIREDLQAFKNDIRNFLPQLGLEAAEPKSQSTASSDVDMEAMVKSALHDALEKLGRTLFSQMQELDFSFQESLSELQVFVKRKLSGLDPILADRRHYPIPKKRPDERQAMAAEDESGPRFQTDSTEKASSVETPVEDELAVSASGPKGGLNINQQELQTSVQENADRMLALLERRLDEFEKKFDAKIDQKLASLAETDFHQHNAMVDSKIRGLQSELKRLLEKEP